MKNKLDIIYTYKTIADGKSNRPKDKGYTKGLVDGVWKLAKLSVEQAKLFGNVKMFCDSESYTKFHNSDIVFDELIHCHELDEFDTHHWGLHKLMVMRDQHNPYLHIDLDTILLKPPKINPNVDVTFGFKAWDFRVGHNIKWDEIDYVYNVYVSNFKKYHLDSWRFYKKTKTQEHDEDIIDFGIQPSLSYVQVNNPIAVRKAVKETLILAKPCLDIDDNDLNQYLEQFTFFTMLKKWVENPIEYVVTSDEYVVDGLDGEMEGNDLNHIKNLDYLQHLDFVHLAASHLLPSKDLDIVINKIKRISKIHNGPKI